MTFIPKELPFFVPLTARRNSKLFRRDPYWKLLRDVIDQAEDTGLVRERCLKLLVGIKSCEDWRDDGRRLTWLSSYQLKAETRRGTKVFKEATQERELYTENYLNRIQTLLFLGYVAANGRARVERRYFYPLTPAFELIINIKKPKASKYEPQHQLIGIVRKRFTRLKETIGGELPFDQALNLLNQVDATFLAKTCG